VDSQLSLGIVIGLFAALTFGLIARQILFAIGTMRAFFRPLVVKQNVGISPVQAVGGCLRGAFILVFWSAVLGGLLVLLMRGML
jgi:hypothetical protein